LLTKPEIIYNIKEFKNKELTKLILYIIKNNLLNIKMDKFTVKK
jgi:hypothetical protein